MNIKCSVCTNPIKYSEDQDNIVCLRCGTVHQNPNITRQKVGNIRNKIIIAVLLCACILISAVLINRKVVIPQMYKKAITLLEKEQYMDSYQIFAKLKNFKDSEKHAKELHAKYPLECSVNGDTIAFGKTNNGNVIEWLVLDRDKRKNKILIIQKYAIYYSEFEGEEGVSWWWKGSKVRSYLNGDFLNDSFSTEERSRILSTPLTTKTEYDGESYETTDKIFALSIKEAKKYFESDDSRKCKFIGEKEKKYYTSFDTDENDYADWWLRDGGKEESFKNYAAIVTSTGSIYEDGNLVQLDAAIRPAMWIDIT